MTMPAHEMTWEESYRRVSRILPTLTKRELDIIGDVADEFRKASAGETEIAPLAESELLAMVDHAILQADQGEVISLEETLAYVDREFGL